MLNQNNKNQVPPNEFDSFQIPPNLNYAYIHQLAKSVGLIDYKADLKKFCPCCNLPIEKELISLCISPNKLAFLGQCYPQYFYSIKLYTLLLLALCCIVGIYNIQTTAKSCYNSEIDLASRDGQVPGCYHFLGIMYSVNRDESELQIQALLTFAGTVFAIVSLVWIKIKQNNLVADTQEQQMTARDYTLMIKHVHPLTTLQEIQEYFIKNYQIDQKKKNPENGEEIIVKEAPTIARIFFASDIEDYTKWKRQKTSLLEEQRKLWANLKDIQDMNANNVKLQSLMLQIQQFDNRIKNFEEQIQLRGDQVSRLRTSFVFVTFNYESELKQVLKIASETFFEKIIFHKFACYGSLFCIQKQNHPLKFLKGVKITIQQAPEPLDIQWENLNMLPFKQFCRQILSIFCSLIVIAIVYIILFQLEQGYIILYGISYVQKTIQDEHGLGRFFVNYILSFFCAILILIINIILNYLVKKLSKLEHHATYTSELRQVTITLIIMEFINTALIPFSLFVFNRKEFNQEDLMASLFFVFIGNMIFVPISLILEPFYLFRLRERRKIINDGFRCQLTQQKAHEIFEGPEFQIADQYSIINKSILTATFYLCIFPYGSIMEIIALIGYYWASKYILLRRCCWPVNLSEQLQNSVYNLMTIIPFTLGIGGFCYEYVLLERSENLSIHLLSMIIGGIEIVYQYLFEIRKKKIQSSNEQNTCFNEQRLLFPIDYDRSNPITMVQAINELNQIWENQKSKIVGNSNINKKNSMIFYNENKQQNQNIIDPEQEKMINQRGRFVNNIGNDYQNDFQRKNFQLSSIYVGKRIIEQNK